MMMMRCFLDLLNISQGTRICTRDEFDVSARREYSKKSVQQGRELLITSRRANPLFDARSVHSVREHGKMAGTPLAAFFNISILGLCVATVCMLNLWGCANTQPTHFYLLGAMDSPTSLATLETKSSGVSLGLGPISIPKYLDRPQIVTRISSNEIDLAEFHKWAEPLKENVINVLQENLSALLSTNRIVQYPWKRLNPPEYQLLVDVIQFDGKKNQEAVLRVRWTLVRNDGKAFLKKKTSQFSEILPSFEYEDFVEAMSRMLASLSREIADTINDLSPVDS